MNSNVCFVIPYFGCLPNYFPLFLKSCSYNPYFNWLLITDDKTKYEYPTNFRVVYMSYEQNLALIQSKFNFKISLERAYKLCDFKPAYGYIYSRYLDGYTHWGHCDTDILIGKLDNYLNDDLLEKYDKLFCLGHLTLYKNTEENNRIFMNPLNGVEIYKRVYSTNKSCCFDEVWKDEYNINTLFIKAGKSVYENDFSLNIDFAHTSFLRVKYVGRKVPNNGHGYCYEIYKPCVYMWEKGHIFRYFIKSNKIEREEFMYIHLQKRKMKVHIDYNVEDMIKIVPNSFLPLEYNKVTMDNFSRIKKRVYNNHYWRIKISPKIIKIKRKLGL